MMSRVIGRWCRHWRDWLDCSPTSRRPRTMTVGQTSARPAVGSLVGGHDLVWQPAAVADLVALLAGPPPERVGVLSGLPRRPRPAAGPATTTEAPGVLPVAGEELVQLGGVRLGQVALVVAAVVAEPHRGRRRRTVQVIDQFN